MKAIPLSSKTSQLIMETTHYDCSAITQYLDSISRENADEYAPWWVLIADIDDRRKTYGRIVMPVECPFTSVAGREAVRRCSSGYRYEYAGKKWMAEDLPDGVESRLVEVKNDDLSYKEISETLYLVEGAEGVISLLWKGLSRTAFTKKFRAERRGDLYAPAFDLLMGSWADTNIDPA